VPQHQWVSRLFGFDFSMEYRPGRLNTVANALSRHDSEASLELGDTAAAVAISGPSFTYIDDVRRTTATAPDATLLQERLRTGELTAP
jgi:hypothetical protein